MERQEQVSGYSSIFAIVNAAGCQRQQTYRAVSLLQMAMKVESRTLGCPRFCSDKDFLRGIVPDHSISRWLMDDMNKSGSKT